MLTGTYLILQDVLVEQLRLAIDQGESTIKSINASAPMTEEEAGREVLEFFIKYKSTST